MECWRSQNVDLVAATAKGATPSTTNAARTSLAFFGDLNTSQDDCTIAEQSRLISLTPDQGVIASRAWLRQAEWLQGTVGSL
jgi:hypothetical protein